MTPDRALELAQAVLHAERARAQHEGSPGLARDCAAAVDMIQKLRDSPLRVLFDAAVRLHG